MKLFHCIVVMGAAMGAGCGGKEEVAGPVSGDAGTDATSGSSSGSAGSSGSTSEAGGLMFPQDAGCDSPPSFGSGPGCQYNGVCGAGTPQAPLGPHDCAHPQQLECNFGMPCTCNTAAPLVPSDCPSTSEFHCDDWLRPCGCRCSPNAVPGPSACGCDGGAAADASQWCPGGVWQCHSYEPPVDCQCFPSVPIL
jgi:hypothetical protein